MINSSITSSAVDEGGHWDRSDEEEGDGSGYETHSTSEYQQTFLLLRPRLNLPCGGDGGGGCTLLLLCLLQLPSPGRGGSRS